MRFADRDDVVNAITTDVRTCHVNCAGDKVLVSKEMFLPQKPAAKTTRVIRIELN
jgi:hypothetical protein